MSVKETIRRLLELVEGHEDKIAKQVSKRTSVSEKQAKEGLEKVQEVVNENSTDNVEDSNRR